MNRKWNRKLLGWIMTFVLIMGMMSPLLKLETKAASKDFVIENLVSPGSTTLYKGSEFYLTFDIKNVSGDGINPITDIYIEIPESNFYRKSGGSTVKMADLVDGVTDTYHELLIYDGGDSNKIPIKIVYGTKTQTDYITVNTSPTSSSSGGPTPDPAQYKPILKWVEDTIPSVETGLMREVTFTIKNTSSYQAKNVRISPKIPSELIGKMTLQKLTMTPTDETINANTTKDFKITFMIDNSVSSGMYPLTLQYEYLSPFNIRFETEQTVYINIVKSDKDTPLTISSHSSAPNPPVIGEKITLKQVIKNNTNKAIKNIKLSIEGLPSESFQLMDTVSEHVFSVNQYSTNTVTMNYQIPETMKGGSFPYKLKLSYIDAVGNERVQETNYNLYIAPTATASEKPKATLKLENIQSPKGGVKPEEDFLISFDVVNNSSVPAKNIKVALTNQETIWSKSSSVIYFDELAANAKQTVTFSMTSSKDSASKNYPLNFEVTYDATDESEPVQGKINQIAGVYIDNTAKQNNASVPKIIISSYTVDPLIVNAGSEFQLDLTFYNTHMTKEVQNIKAFITVTDESKDTGSVFTPVNSSNTFFVDSIAPKKSVDKSIRMYTVPDASPKTYTITVHFEYEDSIGTQLTAQELVGINVKQPTKLDVTELQLPTETFVGQGFYVHFDMYNTGKVKLYNLMIKAVGNFTADTPNYYIGNFDPGNQDYYDGMITPNEPGQLTGQFVISYDDPVGEHFEIIRDFNINVMEMMMEPFPGGMPGEFPGEFPDGKDPNMTGDKGLFSGIYKWLLFAGIGISIVVLVIIGLVIRKKIRNKKGLSFDEE